MKIQIKDFNFEELCFDIMLGAATFVVVSLSLGVFAGVLWCIAHF
jgi:hypothetical protein